MKIEQEKKFYPITMTLETPREAEMMLQVMHHYFKDHAKGPVEIDFYGSAAAWLQNKAQIK